MVIFQGDGDDIILRPRGAGLPGGVPVRGLWGKHHLLAWAYAGLPVGQARSSGIRSCSEGAVAHETMDIYISPPKLVTEAIHSHIPNGCPSFTAQMQKNIHIYRWLLT